MNTLVEILNGPFGSLLEREILPAWIPERRWFRSKARALQTVVLETRLPLGAAEAPLFAVLRVTFAEGGAERYALPLALVSPNEAAALPEDAVLGPMPMAKERILIDGCWDADFRARLFDVLSGQKDFQGEGGTLRGRPASSVVFHAEHRDASTIISAEQSNTSLVYGSGSSAVFVKLYRRLEAGPHPEPEMLRYLREHADYRGVPAFLSALEWTATPGFDGTPPASFTVALAQEFLPGGVNAWEYATAVLRSLPATATPAGGALPDDFLAWVGTLGRRVGELHAALASRADIPAFAPEPLTAADLDGLRARTRASLHDAFAALEAGMETFPPETAALARTFLAGRARLETLLQKNGNGATGTVGKTAGLKIRTHGDLHLGQILTAGGDVRILDFEGEPGRPLAEARAKQSPLRDVAGMLRSFAYAAHVAAAGNASLSPETADKLADRLGAAFLAGYREAPGGDAPDPAGGADDAGLLALFMLEKAVYELHYECNNRPDWAPIPLRGLVTFCNDIPKNS